MRRPLVSIFVRIQFEHEHAQRIATSHFKEENRTEKVCDLHVGVCRLARGVVR